MSCEYGNIIFTLHASKCTVLLVHQCAANFYRVRQWLNACACSAKIRLIWICCRAATSLTPSISRHISTVCSSIDATLLCTRFQATWVTHLYVTHQLIILKWSNKRKAWVLCGQVCDAHSHTNIHNYRNTSCLCWCNVQEILKTWPDGKYAGNAHNIRWEPDTRFGSVLRCDSVCRNQIFVVHTNVHTPMGNFLTTRCCSTQEIFLANWRCIVEAGCHSLFAR